MRITPLRVACFISVVSCAVLVANFLKSLSSDLEDEMDSLDLKELSYLMNQRSLNISDSYNHLMWFVQVSDLHLSLFQDPSRKTELLELCDITFKIINPSVILATGDITDSKTKDMVGSQQFKEEWDIYKEVLDQCNTLKKVPWLDIRGNHDNFDVPDVNSSKNFFRSYSMQGKNHSRSYVHKLSVGSENYAFIGVDACPAVGLKRPFNFFGILPDKEISQLKTFYKSIFDVDFTIWFGHYPTSCILSHQPGIRSVIGKDYKSLAYLCGHFHNLLGVVPNMYTIQKNGFYELELSDWKDNRMFRVASIDHGLFSFVDVKHKDWPITLVTNPKHAMFQSNREPLEAMITSSHIRVLVFSVDDIISVRIKIDQEPWDHALPISGPLYVMPWKPQSYSTGIHYIYVAVLDKSGSEKVIEHPFSLDGSKIPFKFLSRILLMLSFSSVLQVLYGLAVVCCVLPYCFLRYLNKQILENNKKLPFIKKNSVRHWIRRLWILSNINSFFYPIVLYPLYITIGPWTFAEVLKGEIGVIFIWGIFVRGTYIPASFTYGYGFVQLFLFHGPLVAFTAFSLETKLTENNNTATQNKVLWAFKLSGCLLPFLTMLLSQILMSYSFYLAYGPWAVIGPIRLWPVILVVWVWYRSKTFPPQQMRAAVEIWDRNTDRS